MKKHIFLLLITLTLSFTVILTSCEEHDRYWDDDSILGSWGMYDYDPVYGSYSYSMTFHPDGYCTITVLYDYYPQYNNSTDYQFALRGSLYRGANLDIWGYDYAGAVEYNYQATSDGRTLSLYDYYDGSYLILERY